MAKKADPMKNLGIAHSDELAARGVSRRNFLRFCTAMTATMGLPATMIAKVADAVVANSKRPPVIWLQFQECTGCTESLLRATHPTVDALVLDIISLDYSETLCAAAGHQVEAALHSSVEANAGNFILVCEGSVPTKDDGIYCKIAGRTALEIVQDIGPKAAAVVAIGSCASWGGIQSSGPNPTGAKGIHEILTDQAVINLPGCPASPYNLLSTVLYYLILGKLPELDSKNRPTFAYGRFIHENCERRPHFDNGRFVKQFGDEGHLQGWCLYEMGCKGPETHANCGIQKFGDTGSWPIGIGHPCFGCTEKGVGFTKAIHERADLFTEVAPAFYPGIVEEKKGRLSPGAAAILGGIAGAAIGSGYMAASRKSKPEAELTGQEE